MTLNMMMVIEELDANTMIQSGIKKIISTMEKFFEPENIISSYILETKNEIKPSMLTFYKLYMKRLMTHPNESTVDIKPIIELFLQDIKSKVFTIEPTHNRLATLLNKPSYKKILEEYFEKDTETTIDELLKKFSASQDIATQSGGARPRIDPFKKNLKKYHGVFEKIVLDYNYLLKIIKGEGFIDSLIKNKKQLDDLGNINSLLDMLITESNKNYINVLPMVFFAIEYQKKLYYDKDTNSKYRLIKYEPPQLILKKHDHNCSRSESEIHESKTTYDGYHQAFLDHDNNNFHGQTFEGSSYRSWTNY